MDFNLSLNFRRQGFRTRTQFSEVLKLQSTVINLRKGLNALIKTRSCFFCYCGKVQDRYEKNTNQILAVNLTGGNILWHANIPLLPKIFGFQQHPRDTFGKKQRLTLILISTLLSR